MKTSPDRSFLLSVEQYETLLKETKQTHLYKNNIQSLSRKQYCRLKRYDILNIGDSEKLNENGSDSTVLIKIRLFLITTTRISFCGLFELAITFWLFL